MSEPHDLLPRSPVPTHQLRHQDGTFVAASLLLLTAGTAGAQWRTIRTVDDATTTCRSGSTTANAGARRKRSRPTARNTGHEGPRARTSQNTTVRLVDYH